MAATRAQKMRLGIFLIVTTTIIVITLIYLLGASLMEVRDPYVVVLQGGSAGLEVGSQVRFNDIVVGRVEHVSLDIDHPNTSCTIASIAFIASMYPRYMGIAAGVPRVTVSLSMFQALRAPFP